MKYRYMGNTGLLVSRICLGTMTFGKKDWGCDQETAIRITRDFVAAGGNFIDTADTYSDGVSEAIIGEALKELNRDEIVLATKVYFKMGKTPNSSGLSRKHIIEGCEASLRRLQTDYIDLYQVHGPDPRTPWEETLRALDDLVRQGKVRYYGCCNLHAWQIVKANGVSARLNVAQLACAQLMYNMVIRDVEREILPACADQGMGFICWAPMAGGLLTGKYKPAERPEAGSRISLRSADISRYWNERGFRVAAAVSEEAKLLGKNPGQVALAWILKDRRVTATIIGVRKLEQLIDNLAVGDWELPAESWERLNEASHFDLGYPDSWIGPSVKKNINVAEF